MADRIAAIGPFAESGASPEQVGEFLKAEHARWSVVTQEIGLLPE